MPADKLWWRQRWMEAVYVSDLKPLERLVATIYADHAYDKRTSWVTLDRLCQRSRLSRDAANRALKGLVSADFLVVTESKPRRPTTYGLVIPPGLASTADVPPASTGDVLRGSAASPSPDIGSTSADIGSTGDVLHQSPYQRSDPIPLSRDQELVAELLLLEPRDKRLSNVPRMLTDNNVRSSRAWLKAVARDQTLLALLEAATPKADPDARIQAKPTSGPNQCEGCGRSKWSHLPDCPTACRDCGNSSDAHAPHCPQRQQRLCDGGCGQIVSLADIARQRPCKVCSHVPILTREAS